MKCYSTTSSQTLVQTPSSSMSMHEQSLMTQTTTLTARPSSLPRFIQEVSLSPPTSVIPAFSSNTRKWMTTKMPNPIGRATLTSSIPLTDGATLPTTVFLLTQMSNMPGYVVALTSSIPLTDGATLPT